MREIEILGIPLKERSVRESMRRVDEMFDEDGISTIGLITMKGLMAASESESIKEFVESLYLTVISDADILTAAGAKQRARYHEVESNAFMIDFVRKLYRERKAVYLLSANDEALKKLKNELVGYEKHLKIVGECLINEENTEEKAVNEVNMSGADVLISNLPTPVREEFNADFSKMLNVPVWLMMREDRENAAGRAGFSVRISEWLTKRGFKIAINRYRKTEK